MERFLQYLRHFLMMTLVAWGAVDDLLVSISTPSSAATEEDELYVSVDAKRSAKNQLDEDAPQFCDLVGRFSRCPTLRALPSTAASCHLFSGRDRLYALMSLQC